MADEVIKFLRSDLMRALQNERLVKAFEAILREVTVVIPGDNTLILGIAQEANSKAEGASLGAYGPRNPVPSSIRVAEGLTLRMDGAGPTIGLDLGHVLLAAQSLLPKPRPPTPQRPVDDASEIMAVRAFIPRMPPPPTKTPSTDAQAILAAQVFGRR